MEKMENWLVVGRDVSASVRVLGERSLMAMLVLDPDSGAVLTTQIAPEWPASISQALLTASTSPDRHGDRDHPPRLLAPAELYPVIARVAKEVDGLADAAVAEVVPGDDVEDLLDSLIGHLSGRVQPGEPPTSGDVWALYGQAARFVTERVWGRWPEDLAMEITLGRGAKRRRLRAVVMGNSGIQHGLLLTPKRAVAKGAMSRDEDGDGLGSIPGSISMILESKGVPPDLAARAQRHGWPAGEELLPAFVVDGGDEGLREPGADDVRVLTATLAAIIEHDDRSSAPGVIDAVETKGEFRGADGRTVPYHVIDADLDGNGSENEGPPFLFDVLPDGTEIEMEITPWGAFDVLRGNPGVVGSQLPTHVARKGPGVPLVVLDVGRDDGDRAAARLNEAGPLGIEVVGHGNDATLTLVCHSGLLPLATVDSSDLAIGRFQRQRRKLDGVHAVLVADWERVPDSNAIYGLWELDSLPMPSIR